MFYKNKRRTVYRGRGGETNFKRRSSVGFQHILFCSTNPARTAHNEKRSVFRQKTVGQTRAVPRQSPRFDRIFQKSALCIAVFIVIIFLFFAFRARAPRKRSRFCFSSVLRFSRPPRPPTLRPTPIHFLHKIL